jgi:hypothetical protein
MARTCDPPPPRFLEKDYGYLRGLDAAGWLGTLQECLRKLDDAAKRDAGAPTFEEEWGPMLRELGKDVSSLLPGFVCPPVVHVVEKADLSALIAIEKPAMLLQVYLRATDSLIIKEFKKALAEARKKHPAPAKRPGPWAPNGKFDKLVFDRWITNQIVPLADLIDWGSREKVKNPVFGRWLFPERDDEHKLMHRARKTLYEAVNLIPALSMQVDAERVAAKASPKLPPK